MDPSMESLRRALREAEQANRQKSDLLSRTSHEIRTQLSAIIGNASLLMETRLSPEQDELVGMIASAGDSLLTLVNDLLDAGRLEAGRLSVDRVPFRLTDVISDSVGMFRAAAEAKGIGLSLHIDTDVPEQTIGDPSRLRQIVANLVGNAVKFTQRGTVDVQVVRLPGDLTEIQVIDTGPGIARDQLAAIFRPYHQASNDAAGSGLGLAISRQLVDLMGGSMRVSSDVGLGSTFAFSIPTPLVITQDSGSRSQGEIADLPALVLTHDDRRARWLVETLAGIGLDVTTVASIEHAEQLLEDFVVRQNPFALVLVDVEEPLEACTRLRARSETMPTHLAVLTVGGRRGDGARCRELRVGAYLTQPLGSAEIAEAIREVLLGPAPEDLTVLVTRHWLRERRRRLSVLVVDDSATHRMNLTRLFERRGHRVTATESGEEALEELDRHEFDVVVMDILMPGMGGLEAIRQVRRRWPNAATNIVAMTVGEDPDVHRQALEAGADAMLLRPYDANELFNAVDSLIPVSA